MTGLCTNCLATYGAGAVPDVVSYDDVDPERWSYDDITYVSEEGYMNGVGDDKFDPSGKVTRAMVVTVLYRVEGSPAVSSDPSFSDVKSGTWYTDAVRWAKDNEIVNGTSPTTFAPNANITREQLAAIMMRYAKFKHFKIDTDQDISSYKDASKISAYAVDAMKWANKIGLITGIGDTLQPRGTATREQFAAILHRFDNTDFVITALTSYIHPVLSVA